MDINEINKYLKKLESIHAKKFKDNKFYIDKCKANVGLNLKDYKIHSNHNLNEYFYKYGDKLPKGKLSVFKKDELWMMNKGTNYWKIPNDSEFIYFEVPKNLKPLWISLIAILAAGAIAGGVTIGVLFYLKSASSEPPLHEHWYQYSKEEKWWEHCSNNGVEAATEEDVGKTVKITLNGVGHSVRLIGVDHKEPGETTAQAHCTFEFVDLISDSNGYSLATYWQDTNTTVGSNYNYLNSSVRSTLNGKYDNPTKGSTQNINWFQIDDKNFSNDYSGKSVLSMLPAELSDAIVPVTKKVNIKGEKWSETDCTDKIFLLTPKEMGHTASNMETGVTTYKYYEGHTSETDTIRIKKQINGTIGARADELSGTDLDGAYTGGAKHSYAGYNKMETDDQGGRSWLRSPHTFYNDYAWHVNGDGEFDGYYDVYNYAFSVAPAFCI